ncbi:MAG: thioesterase domain-containing protein [Chromatiales bacterium]|jgi:thioesterase domain-containing protein
MLSASQLEQRLHRQIPLTQAIGLRVSRLDAQEIRLSAPLENNFNHKLTAFAGSLYSAAVLAGWGLLASRLEALELHGHIVVQDANIRYLQPVNGDIDARCRISDAAAFDRFINLFRHKSRARILLETEIFNADAVAVQFSGNYVVHA